MVAQGPTSSSGLPVVAFSRGQTAHLDLAAGKHLQFNRKILDINAAIDADGIFKCVTAGLYAFHFNALTDSNTTLWLDIYKNNNSVGTAYAHANASYADAGNSVILYLNVNDQIMVRTHGNFANSLYGAPDQIYSTFTGILLDSGIHGTCSLIQL